MSRSSPTRKAQLATQMGQLSSGVMTPQFYCSLVLNNWWIHGKCLLKHPRTIFTRGLNRNEVTRTITFKIPAKLSRICLGIIPIFPRRRSHPRRCSPNPNRIVPGSLSSSTVTFISAFNDEPCPLIMPPGLLEVP